MPRLQVLGVVGDVRTPRIGKREMRWWMEEMQNLAEVEDPEFTETVELINELEKRIEAPPEERLAA